MSHGSVKTSQRTVGSSLPPIAVTTYSDQIQLGEEKVYLAYLSPSQITTERSQKRKSKAGTQRQELKLRQQKNTTHWFIPPIQLKPS